MREYVCGIEDDYEGVPWGSDDYSGTCERREEVVRCRDCSYASSAGLDCNPEARYCVAMDTVIAPDGFCAWGARRDA